MECFQKPQHQQMRQRGQAKPQPKQRAQKARTDSESETPFWGATTSGLSDEGDAKSRQAGGVHKSIDPTPENISTRRSGEARKNFEQSKSNNDEYLGVAPVPAFDTNALPPVKKAKWGDLGTRAGWSIVMVIAFSMIIYAGHVAILGLVIAIQSALFSEILNLRKDLDKEKRIPFLGFVRWYFFVVMLVYGHGRSLKTQICHLAEHLEFSPPHWGPSFHHVDCFMESHEFICFILYSLGIVFFVLTLRKGQLRYQFGSFAWTHMTLLLVILQTTWLSANIFSGLIWFVVPAFLVICNDTTAYLCGRAFGRTPLIALSPKKTLEGFVGATLCTVLFAVLLTDALSHFQHMVCVKETLDFSAVDCEPSPLFVHANYNVNPRVVSLLPFLPSVVRVRPVQLHAISLALFASSIGPFGGFFASGIKRALKKKDFGDIIPGHGGVTDRFDCQILMAAFTFFYYRTFLYVRPVTVASVMHLLRQLSSDDKSEVLRQLGDLVAL